MRNLMSDWAATVPAARTHAAPAANAAAHATAAAAAAVAPPAALRRANSASGRPGATGARHLSGGGGGGGQRPPSGPVHVWLPASGDLVLQPTSDGGPLRAVGSGDRGG